MVASDSIFALASGAGRAGIAVIRLSGPAVAAAVVALTDLETLPEPRRAVRIGVLAPGDGELLDRGLLLWFPGPRSYTGEDVAEFHLHGGLAKVDPRYAGYTFGYNRTLLANRVHDILTTIAFSTQFAPAGRRV